MKKGEELRKEFLLSVEGCVCKSRQNEHGEAEDNFNNIARIWNVQLGPKLKAPITALDVGYLMIGLKLARATHAPENFDNALDAAGYAACVGGILLRKKEPHDPLPPVQ